MTATCTLGRDESTSQRERIPKALPSLFTAEEILKPPWRNLHFSVLR